MLTRHQVAAARARADAATSGPWRDEIGEIVQLTDGGKGYPLNSYPDSAVIVEMIGHGDCDHSIAWLDADRHFMASSRTDLPAALDALEEVMGALHEHLATTIVFAAVASEGHLLNEEQTGIRGDVEEHRRTMVRLRALLAAYDADANDGAR